MKSTSSKIILIPKEEEVMNLKSIVAAVLVAAAHFSVSPASAGQTISEESGKYVCVIDKWDEKEPEKGHKLVDSASRDVYFPDDPSKYALFEGQASSSDECVGKYEYMPDGSWKGSGTCIETFKGGDKLHFTFEEGSHLKESTYQYTAGTGKYKNAKGGGTYKIENLTDTLCSGWYKGKIELP